MVLSCNFVVMDCPGSDNYLSRLAHACADTLITPINDSFIDLDMLARIDPDSLAIKGPSRIMPNSVSREEIKDRTDRNCWSKPSASISNQVAAAPLRGVAR